MEYDVFISCKSEDYPIAERLYRYLKDNGFYVFLSSMELRRLKESEYMDAISDALDSTYHLIVLGSSRENIMSKWVKFEWSTFLNEQLSGRKDGQIMTYVDGGITVANLPIQLRHYESFTSQNYKGNILHYVETPAYLKRKEEAERQAKLEAEKARSLKEAEQDGPFQAQIDSLLKNVEELKAQLQSAPNADNVKYVVRLTGINGKKFQVLKVLVDSFGMGLKEGKQLVDNAPVDLPARLSLAQKDSVCQLIEMAGGTCEWRMVANESETFIVRLTDVRCDKLQLMKVLKDTLGMGLNETKNLIDNAPIDLPVRLSLADKESICQLIELVGGKCEARRVADVNETFIVRLTHVGSNKLQLIKGLQASLGVGLNEAKGIADSAPSDIPFKLSFDQKESLCWLIEEVGGAYEVRKAQ